MTQMLGCLSEAGGCDIVRQVGRATCTCIQELEEGPCPCHVRQAARSCEITVTPTPACFVRFACAEFSISLLPQLKFPEQTTPELPWAHRTPRARDQRRLADCLRTNLLLVDVAFYQGCLSTLGQVALSPCMWCVRKWQRQRRPLKGCCLQRHGLLATKKHFEWVQTLQSQFPRPTCFKPVSTPSGVMHRRKRRLRQPWQPLCQPTVSFSSAKCRCILQSTILP